MLNVETGRVAAALRVLADAFEGAQPPAGALVSPQAGTPETPPKRGRGRPVKTEEIETAAAAPAVEADPFSAPAPTVPTATLDDVRKALLALKNATSQDNALGVLKKVGEAENLALLKPAKYGVLVAEINGFLTAQASDPFDMPQEEQKDLFATEPQEKPLAIEDVKAIIVETQKRTSADAVQKLVMSYGGKAKNPDTGADAPSLKALPVDQYAAVAAALKALPSTK